MLRNWHLKSVSFLHTYIVSELYADKEIFFLYNKQHNFLMHALLIFSARHLTMLEPFEKQYEIHELQHRQHALGTIRLILSDIGVTASNYDALIAANTLLAFHSS